jgi:transcriptional regulator with XRE-family HTH domain
MLSPRQIQQLRREPAEPNRLKAAMRLSGATQVTVSAGTGITQSHISKIANSGTRVTLETAARIASYFRCQIADLFPRETAVEVRHAS